MTGSSAGPGIDPHGTDRDDADRFDLARFVRAQDDGGTYATAIAELRRGRKTSHWMWFVFPQIAGLGSSGIARRYAIASLDEARAYLAHPVLGARLDEAAATVADSTAPSAEALLGGIDALKLRSSVTLFLRARQGSGDPGSADSERGDPGRADPRRAALERVLERYYGGVADDATDRLLGTRPVG